MYWISLVCASAPNKATTEGLFLLKLWKWFCWSSTFVHPIGNWGIFGNRLLPFLAESSDVLFQFKMFKLEERKKALHQGLFSFHNRALLQFTKLTLHKLSYSVLQAQFEGWMDFFFSKWRLCSTWAWRQISVNMTTTRITASPTSQAAVCIRVWPDSYEICSEDFEGIE